MMQFWADYLEGLKNGATIVPLREVGGHSKKQVEVGMIIEQYGGRYFAE